MATGPTIDRLGASGLLVLGYARQCADELGADAIEPAHLLLGLGRLGDLDVQRVLRAGGVDLDTACALLAKPAGKGKSKVPDLMLSVGAAAVMRASEKEMARLGGRRVEALHFVLGLVAEPDGAVSSALLDLGADRGAITLEGQKTILAGRGVPPSFYKTREHVEQAGRARTTELLETLGRDLTADAEQGRLTPIIGRDREIEALVTTLLSMRANDAVLVGEAGVGKTAVVEGLAQRIVDGRIPQLAGTRIRTIEVGALVAGTRYRGEFEQRLTNLIEGLRGSDDILFIDELHMLVGAGETGRTGSVDAANILKPALARGELRVIGATTLADYRLHIEPDAALARRFHRIVVGEPSSEETRAILDGLRKRYEEWHVVTITDDALDSVLELSLRHQHDRQLPDKALELLDAACTRTKLSASVKSGKRKKAPTVDADRVTDAASLVLGIPVGRLRRDRHQVFTELPATLKARVVGQDEAIDTVCRALVRTDTGFAQPDRPSGAFLFVGPTGTGKTTLARELAAALFDQPSEIVQLDLGRYVTASAVTELVGAPIEVPGWDRGGRLTNAVRARPYSVVLLEDVDAAHLAVGDLLAEVLTTGRLTDALDRVADFRQTVVVMTTNTGVGGAVGFAPPDSDSGPAAPSPESVRRDLDGLIPPDVVQHVDEIVTFIPPTHDAIRRMIEQQLDAMPVVRVEVERNALDLLADEAYTPSLGGHLVSPTLQRLVVNPLSIMVASKEVNEGDTVHIEAHDGELRFARM